MGRLRICCLLLVLVSAALALYSRLDEMSRSGLISLAIGTLVLAAAVPFPARQRRSRRRVVGACAAYTIAALGTLVMILGANPKGAVGPLLALPALGAVLTLWAYLTRNRTRVSGFHNYYRT